MGTLVIMALAGAGLLALGYYEPSLFFKAIGYGLMAVTAIISIKSYRYERDTASAEKKESNLDIMYRSCKWVMFSGLFGIILFYFLGKANSDNYMLGTIFTILIYISALVIVIGMAIALLGYLIIVCDAVVAPPIIYTLLDFKFRRWLAQNGGLWKLSLDNDRLLLEKRDGTKASFDMSYYGNRIAYRFFNHLGNRLIPLGRNKYVVDYHPTMSGGDLIGFVQTSNGDFVAIHSSSGDGKSYRLEYLLSKDAYRMEKGKGTI